MKPSLEGQQFANQVSFDGLSILAQRVEVSTSIRGLRYSRSVPALLGIRQSIDNKPDPTLPEQSTHWNCECYIAVNVGMH
jgi:hypothetical protein